MQEVVARIARRPFRFRRDEVERAAARLQPEPLDQHYVVVAGKRFPPKQLLASITGLDRADFISTQARSIFERLGFPTGRVDAPVSTNSAPDAPDGRPASDRARADRLRPYRGRWVALDDAGEVLRDGASPEEVLAWLRAKGLECSLFLRVPLDPTVDIGGFAS